MDILESLPSNIKDNLSIEDGHWIWTGSIRDITRNHLQGQVRFNGKNEYPHRVVYHLLKGYDLNSPLQLNHKRTCPYSLCCNPECIYVGNQQENVQDSIALGHNKELNKKVCSKCGGRYKVSPTSGKRYCQRCKNLRRDMWRLNKNG